MLRRRPAKAEADASVDAPPTPVKTVTIDPTRGPLGVTLSNDASGLGVKIDRLHPNDLVDRAGLLVGHVITKLDGEGVSTHESALAALIGASGPVEVSYCSAEQIQATKPRKPSKQKSFDWKLVLLLVLGIGLSLGFATYVVVQQVQRKAGGGNMAGMDDPAPEEPAPAPFEPLVGIERYAKVQELERKLAEVEKQKLDAMGKLWVRDIRRRYLESAGKDEEDPRGGLESLKIMRELTKGFEGVAEEVAKVCTHPHRRTPHIACNAFPPHDPQDALRPRA